MPIARLLTVNLTGAGCQQILQGPKTVLDPVSPLPCPNQPRPANGRVETHQVELVLPRLLDYNERHRAIRRTGGPEPCIAHPRDLGAMTPGPIAGLLQVTPLDLAPVYQF